MDARVWWCVLCVAEEVSTEVVRWHFCALCRSYVRLFSHLIGFHGVTIQEIVVAQFIENEDTGVLLTQPHRHLGAWMGSGMKRDDFHRVGNWESSVFKRDPLTEMPPNEEVF